MNSSGKGTLAKKFALGFGIAVLFPMMIHYGVRSFSPQPRWENYQVRHAYLAYDDKADPAEREKVEAEQRAMEEKRRADEKRFQKHLFCATTPLGILAIIAGTLIGIQAVGSGLMFGGILCLIDGYINYWSELPDFMRFLSLLAGFCILIFIGFKKFNDK